MQSNTQTPEKRVTGDGTVIAVNSIFYTIQGEGPFAGTPAVFVRLAGCNLQCPGCDTEYTERKEMTLDEIDSAVGLAPGPADPDKPWLIAGCGLVVITGGEPFRQPIGKLVRRLRELKYLVQIETNGTLYQPGFTSYFDDGVVIVCSPKTGNVHRELLPSIAAFKYVGRAGELAEDDGLPVRALGHTAHPRLYRPPADWKGEVYLQPMDEQDTGRNRLNREAVVRSCLKHGWRLCLQIHKEIGVP